jgi:hypothetical protein
LTDLVIIVRYFGLVGVVFYFFDAGDDQC